MLRCFAQPIAIGYRVFNPNIFLFVPAVMLDTLSFMQQQWRTLCQRFAPTLEADVVFSQLVQAYTEPHRAYHTLEHIQSCLQEFRVVRQELHAPDNVEWALWLHDIVYDTHKHDNEEQSAHLSATMLQQGEAVHHSIAQTTNLILATRHNAIPTDHDTPYLIDIDLAVLGAPPTVFDAYERHIRREYAWVDEQLYREKRGELLTAFLQREHLYNTPSFRTRYEQQARINIQHSITRLRA